MEVLFKCDICGSSYVKDMIKRSDNLNNTIRLNNCGYYCRKLRHMITKYNKYNNLEDYGIFSPEYWLNFFNGDPKKTVDHLSDNLRLLKKYFKTNSDKSLEFIVYKVSLPRKEFLDFLDRVKNNEIDFFEFRKYNNLNSVNKWKAMGFSDYASEKLSEFFRTTKDGFILRNGDPDLYDQWIQKTVENRTFNKENHPYCIEYWLSYGFSEDDSKDIVSKLNTRDLSFFVNKYGTKEGTKRYNIMCKNRSYSSSLQGYIDKYGESEGRKIFNRICTKKDVSLNSMIAKYGYVEGKERFERRINKMLNSLNSKLFRYGSRIANLFFDKLSEKISYDIEQEVVVNKYAFDGFINELNLVIEFFGDWWHKNPLMYLDNKNFLKQDLEKIQFLKDNNYNFLIIWESCMYKPEKLIDFVNISLNQGLFDLQFNLKNHSFIIEKI